MIKKYKFTKETKTVFGRIVHRIQAVRDFGGIKKGDLGGWIESEKNLSHDGLCWVGEDAEVSGNATVRENARISGNALVCVNARIRENAVVKENARVDGNVLVGESALVYGNAQIGRNALVYGNAQIGGHAKIGGHAMIYGNARISGDSIVCGHATVYGFARIGSPKDIFTASNVGSENGTLTAYRTKTGGVEVIRGCFGGTLDAFTEDVNHKHGNSKIGKEYRILIEFLQVRFSVEDAA